MEMAMSGELEVMPPVSKRDLRQAKSATYNETVSDVMSKSGLERWQVEGVLGDLVMQDKSKESQGKIAKRWGVGFGEVSRCRQMGKLTIDECRAAMGTKSIILADRALDSLMDDMNDPVKLSEMKPKDKLSIAKQLTDNAINLENKAVAGQGQTNIDVGTVQILIQNQQARQKEGGNDAMARLLAKGVNKELIDKAANA
jgi:hypothetical protein